MEPALLDKVKSPRVVAYVLSFNERGHISDVVGNLRSVADVVVVVDSGSSDGTVELAEEAGAMVWHHPFHDFATQRKWALSEILGKWSPEWVLCLDADERLNDELISEVRKVTTASRSSADVYLIRFSLQFSGRTLRFGGFARTRTAKLFKPSSGHYEQRAVNDHFIPDPKARVRTLKGHLIHHDVTSCERYIDKHNVYSSMEANARLLAENQTVRETTFREAVHFPHLRRRWMREKILNHLPAKAFFRFVQLYVFYGGFLDGAAGFNIAVFKSWQELCTDLKYRELVEQRDDSMPESKSQASSSEA